MVTSYGLGGEAQTCHDAPMDRSQHIAFAEQMLDKSYDETEYDSYAELLSDATCNNIAAVAHALLALANPEHEEAPPVSQPGGLLAFEN